MFKFLLISYLNNKYYSVNCKIKAFLFNVTILLNSITFRILTMYRIMTYSRVDVSSAEPLYGALDNFQEPKSPFLIN